MTSQYDVWNKLTWHVIQTRFEESSFLLQIQRISWKIYGMEVYFMYGIPLYKKAIEKTMQPDPPQVINYRTLRVVQLKVGIMQFQQGGTVCM